MSRHLIILTITLVLIGLGVFAYKVLILNVPVVSDPMSEQWNVEARISFNAKGGPVKATMLLPQGAPQLLLLKEDFSSRGFGLTTDQMGSQREVIWAIRQASGRRNLFYHGRFTTRSSIGLPFTPTNQPPASPVEPQPPVFTGSYLQAAEALLTQVQSRSADLPTLATLLLKTLRNPTPNGNAALVIGAKRKKDSIINVAVKLLTLANIPAKAVHGVKLESQRNKAPVITWLEAWDGKQWLAFDPGFSGNKVPEDILPWWSGPIPQVTLQGGQQLEVTLSVARVEEIEAIQNSPLKTDVAPLLRFSTLSLPNTTQLVFKVVLLVPLGALLVVLIRNVIGFRAFGTFMPVLIALAFRETELLNGLVLFVMIVMAGLASRFYLEQLKLLLVPRLAVVMTLVVLLMTGFSIISHQLNLEAGLSIALFPMVILTMTIERMMVVWDERGPGEAIIQGLGSLGAAVAAYLLMNIKWLQYLVFVFPETLLIVIAALLMLGRYSGYRLTELARFRPLVKKEG